MTPVNPFILKNKEKMVNFLDELSVSHSINSHPLIAINRLQRKIA